MIYDEHEPDPGVGREEMSTWGSCSSFYEQDDEAMGDECELDRTVGRAEESFQGSPPDFSGETSDVEMYEDVERGSRTPRHDGKRV